MGSTGEQYCMSRKKPYLARVDQLGNFQNTFTFTNRIIHPDPLHVGGRQNSTQFSLINLKSNAFFSLKILYIEREPEDISSSKLKSCPKMYQNLYFPLKSRLIILDSLFFKILKIFCI